LNELIDRLCHPLTKVDKGFILVDKILHGLAEQNPRISVRKFVKFNLPLPIKQLEKETKKRMPKKRETYIPRALKLQ